MKHIRLRAQEDEIHGGMGLGFPQCRYGEKMNPAAEGLVIAHDILEHQNGVQAIGSVGDELEALGGVWYVRGQHGSLMPNDYGRYSPQENLAWDISNLGRLHLEGIPLRVNIPNTRDHIHDEFFDEILQRGREHLLPELEDYDVECTPENIQEYLTNAKHLLRVGFNKAQRRFEHKGQFYANATFWSITNAIDNLKEELYEGQEFILSYGDTKAQCREVYNEQHW